MKPSNHEVNPLQNNKLKFFRRLVGMPVRWYSGSQFRFWRHHLERSIERYITNPQIYPENGAFITNTSMRYVIQYYWEGMHI